jgi:4-hydroxybenzoate polyprenyltransferase
MDRLLSTAFRMLRLRVLVTILIIGYLGVLSGDNLPRENVLEIILAVLALAFWYLNGTCINDLADEKIDKINLKNAPSRPLVNKKTSRKTLWLMAVAGGVLSLACAAVISVPAFVLICGALVLNWIYSMPPLHISHRGALAPLLLPIGYVALPFLLGLFSVSGKLDSFSTVLLIGAYITFIGRISLKDLRDIEGDRKYGKRTFIVRHGKLKTLYFSGAFWVAGSAVVMGLFADRSAAILVLILAMHLLAVIYAISRMNKTEDRDTQQVILGAIGQIANTSILCIAVWLIYSNGLYSVQNKSFYIFIMIALGIYGTVYGLYAIKRPQNMKVSY